MTTSDPTIPGSRSVASHIDQAKPATRTLVLHPDRVGGSKSADRLRSPVALLEEVVGLAAAISLDVQHSEVVPIRVTRPATLFGSGHLERLKQEIEQREIDLVVVDAAVTPVQQRNLEREWQTKVIDRTGLILEIFGERARTHEGVLQVELAALSYQRSRLVRSWTHLERQRGGFGFLGGPGESQIELDRRLIGDRIVKLKRELEDVRRTRELHRAARKRVPYPIVALVGYTNAGKSTLFNRLGHADVRAEDLLFATLDPTMRGVTLPSGRRIILSDTVGFISELPTHLVAAFRATLEEVLAADVIIHVRDIAHPDSDAQKADVEAVLRDLGIGEAVDHGLFEAWNKMDLLAPEDQAALETRTAINGEGVAISALSGAGMDQLTTRLDQILGARRETIDLDIDLADGKLMAWLYQHGTVKAREDDGQTSHVTVALEPADLERLHRQFAHAVSQH
jgi:GTP-binding protein HflX